MPKLNLTHQQKKLWLPLFLLLAFIITIPLLLFGLKQNQDIRQRAYEPTTTTDTTTSTDNIIFQDDFSTDKGWQMKPNEGSETSIVDNKFSLRTLDLINENNNDTWSLAPFSMNSSPSFSIETDWYQIQGDPEITFAGIIFNANNIFGQNAFNGYHVDVRNSGNNSYFAVHKYQNSNRTTLKDGIFTLAPATSNHLKIIRNQTSGLIQIYIDNVLITEVIDTTHLSGQISLHLGAYDLPAEVRFDNFIVQDLTGGTTPIPGDIDLNGCVDIFDYGIFLTNFNQGPTCQN